MHFEGLAGAVNVSVVAFSIVFGVLLVLTGVIYGMRLFAGSPEKKNDVKPVSHTPSAKPASSAPVAKAAAPSADKAKIIAAITAAIVEFTGSSDFRVVSVQAEAGTNGIPMDYWTARWKTAGMIGLNANRLNRKWH